MWFGRRWWRNRRAAATRRRRPSATDRRRRRSPTPQRPSIDRPSPRRRRRACASVPGRAGHPEELVDDLVARGSVPGAALVVVDADGRRARRALRRAPPTARARVPVGRGHALRARVADEAARRAGRRSWRSRRASPTSTSRWPSTCPGAAPQLTLRNTLAHYSGPARGRADAHARRRPDRRPGTRRARPTPHVAPERGAGERRVYSNPGYVLAGLAVEHAAGHAVRALPRRRPCSAPLGMGATTLGLPAALDDEAAWVREPGLWAHGVPLFNGDGVAPAAAAAVRRVRHGAATTRRFLALRAGRRPPAGRAAPRRRGDAGRAHDQPGRRARGRGGVVHDLAASPTGAAASSCATPRSGTGPATRSRRGPPRTSARRARWPSSTPGTGVAAVLLANRGTYCGWILEPGAWPDLCAAIVRR